MKRLVRALLWRLVGTRNLERKWQSAFVAQQHRQSSPLQATGEAEKAQVLAAYAARQPQLARVVGAPTRRIFVLRPVMLGLCLLATGVLACQVPSTYTVHAGYRLVAHLAPMAEGGAAAHAAEVEQALQRVPGVHGVTLRIMQREPAGGVELELVLWGAQAEVLHAGLQDLRSRFTWLAAVPIEEVPMTTDYSGTLGSRLRHRLGWMTTTEQEDVRAMVVNSPNGPRQRVEVRRVIRRTHDGAVEENIERRGASDE